MRWVRLMTRPNEVSTTSAPSSCARPRDGERDRRVVQHAGDEDALAFEQHERPSLLPARLQAACCRAGGPGRCSRLVANRSSAAARMRRVSLAAMTSSTKPRSAATYGFANRSSYSCSSAACSRARSSASSIARSVRPCRICAAPERAHHRDLGRGPRAAPVVPEPLGVHDDVRAAVRLAQHDAQPRHGGGGVRVDELGAVADHPAPLEVLAGLEARGVDERDEREVEAVAPLHEAGGLLRRLDVERAGAHAAAGWRRCRRCARRAARAR